MKPDEKLEVIEQEIKQLSAKQLELIKQHQKKPFYYRWLTSPDPDLEAINTQIAELKQDKKELYKVIQVS